MSDELEAVAKGGGIMAGLGLAVATMWAAFTRRAEKNEDKLDAEQVAKNTHFEHALDSHRDQLEELKRQYENLKTRLEFREGKYGVEPLTNSGSRPSPLIEALRRKSEEP